MKYTYDCKINASKAAPIIGLATYRSPIPRPAEYCLVWLLNLALYLLLLLLSLLSLPLPRLSLLRCSSLPVWWTRSVSVIWCYG